MRGPPARRGAGGRLSAEGSGIAPELGLRAREGTPRPPGADGRNRPRPKPNASGGSQRSAALRRHRDGGTGSRGSSGGRAVPRRGGRGVAHTWAVPDEQRSLHRGAPALGVAARRRRVPRRHRSPAAGGTVLSGGGRGWAAGVSGTGCGAPGGTRRAALQGAVEMSGALRRSGSAPNPPPPSGAHLGGPRRGSPRPRRSAAPRRRAAAIRGCAGSGHRNASFAAPTAGRRASASGGGCGGCGAVPAVPSWPGGCWGPRRCCRG